MPNCCVRFWNRTKYILVDYIKNKTENEKDGNEADKEILEKIKQQIEQHEGGEGEMSEEKERHRE